MGSIFKSKPDKTTKTSERVVDLPGYIQRPLEDLIGRAESLSLEDYSPYEGQRVSDFTSDDINSFNMLRQQVGRTGGLMADASGVTREVGRRGLEGFSQSELDPWMNPYIENVLDVGRRRRFEDYDTQMRDLRQRAGEAGSFGGSRFALAERGMAEDFRQNMADFETMGLSDAYNQGLAGAMQGTQLAGQSAMDRVNQAGAIQGADYRDIGGLQSVGTSRRGLDQANLDVNYQDWLQEQAYPYEQANFLGNLLLPAGQLTAGSTTTDTTIQEKGGGSTFGKIMGIASLAAAPFTGGASLMGGMGGMGSMMGLAGGAGGLMSAIGTGANMMGGGLATAVNSFGRAGGASAMGPFMTPNAFGRYNQGGKVGLDGYNDGGAVGGQKVNLMKFIDRLYEATDDDEDYGMGIDIVEDTEMYPGGPLGTEYLDMWEQIDNGELRPPAPRDTFMEGQPVRNDGTDPDLVSHWASLEDELNLPRGILRAKRQVESSGGKNLVSPVGARGPFQLMPITQEHLGVKDPFDEYESARGAAKLMREYLDMFDGDFDKAMAAYNWGPGNVKRKGMEKMPKETRNHLKKLKREMGTLQGLNDGGRLKNLFSVGPLTLTKEDREAYERGELAPWFSIPNFYTDTKGTPAKQRGLAVLDYLQNKSLLTDGPKDIDKLVRSVGPVDKGLDMLQEGITNVGDYVVENPVESAGYALMAHPALRTAGTVGKMGLGLVKGASKAAPLAKTVAKNPLAQAAAGLGLVQATKTGEPESMKDRYDREQAELEAALAEQGRNPDGSKDKKTTTEDNPREQLQALTEKALGMSPSSSGEKTAESTKKEEKSKFNYPLAMFGAALLSSDKDFFEALGDASKAGIGTSMSLKEREKEYAQQQLENKLKERAYQIQEGNLQARLSQIPLENELTRAKTIESLRKLQTDPAFMKRYSDILKELIGNNISGEDDMILQQRALQLAADPRMGGGTNSAGSAIVDYSEFTPKR